MFLYRTATTTQQRNVRKMPIHRYSTKPDTVFPLLVKTYSFNYLIYIKYLNRYCDETRLIFRESWSQKTPILIIWYVKVPTHYSGSGGGSVKMSPDRILQPPLQCVGTFTHIYIYIVIVGRWLLLGEHKC